MDMNVRPASSSSILKTAHTSQPPKFVDPSSYTVYVITALFLAAVCGGFIASSFSYDGRALNEKIFGLCIAIPTAYLFRIADKRRIATFLEVSALFGAISLLGIFSSMMLSAIPIPYADILLSNMDRMMGFDWMAVFKPMSDYKGIMNLQASVYLSFNWQPMLLIFLLCALGLESECWLFVTAWAVALALTVVIFPFFPAKSALIVNQISPVRFPEIAKGGTLFFYDIMEDIRSGRLRVIGFRQLTGMITFPSFHAAAAIVIGWGYGQIPYLRWPFVLLNLTMIISAIYIGGHYLIDIVAGIVIGFGSLLISHRLLRAQRASDGF